MELKETISKMDDVIDTLSETATKLKDIGVKSDMLQQGRIDQFVLTLDVMGDELGKLQDKLIMDEVKAAFKTDRQYAYEMVMDLTKCDMELSDIAFTIGVHIDDVIDLLDEFDKETTND